MVANIEMSVSEFKAKCLDLFGQLADHRLAGITVTRHGKPVAEIGPPRARIDRVDGLFGYMAGSVIAAPEVDFTAAVIDPPDETALLPR